MIIHGYPDYMTAYTRLSVEQREINLGTWLWTVAAVTRAITYAAGSSLVEVLVDMSNLMAGFGGRMGTLIHGGLLGDTTIGDALLSTARSLDGGLRDIHTKGFTLITAEIKRQRQDQVDQEELRHIRECIDVPEEWTNDLITLFWQHNPPPFTAEQMIAWAQDKHLQIWLDNDFPFIEQLPAAMSAWQSIWDAMEPRVRRTRADLVPTVLAVQQGLEARSGKSMGVCGRLRWFE